MKTYSVSNEVIDILNAKIKKYSSLSLTSIFINQQSLENDFKEQKRFLSELRFRDSLDLVDKNRQIKILEQRLKKLEKQDEIEIFYNSIIKEIKISFDSIIDFYKTVKHVDSDKDTISVFTAKWSKNISTDYIEIQEEKIRNLLKFKLTDSTFV